MSKSPFSRGLNVKKSIFKRAKCQKGLFQEGNFQSGRFTRACKRRVATLPHSKLTICQHVAVWEKYENGYFRNLSLFITKSNQFLREFLKWKLNGDLRGPITGTGSSSILLLNTCYLNVTQGIFYGIIKISFYLG